MTAEVDVIEATGRQDYLYQLRIRLGQGWEIVSEEKKLNEAGEWQYNTTLMFDHGRNVELAFMCETMKQHTNQIEWINQWIAQQPRGHVGEET
jgi:hypothetical protein